MGNKTTGYTGITNKLLLIGFLISAIFWIVEAFLEAFVFYHGGSFIYYLFPPEPHIIWHRLVVIGLFIVFGLVAFFNVTERRKSEKLIEESEKKYRELVDNALIGVYKSSLKGNMLYANEALAKIFEFNSPDEMMQGGALSRYKNPKDREVLIESLKKTGKLDGFQVEAITKTGKLKNLLLSTSLDGDILSGMVVDITETVRLEENLKQRIKDLEEFYDLAVGRELRMVELKEEMERLKNQLKSEK